MPAEQELIARPSAALAPVERGARLPSSLWPRLALACTVGAAATTGWAPLACWPLSLAGYALLFSLLRRTGAAGQAAAIGAAFGVGVHAAGHGWVFSSMRDLMSMPAPLALFGSAFFVAYLSLFTALPCALWRRGTACSPPWAKALGWAAWMMLGEYMRSLPFNGFTSLSLGYALLDAGLAGLAPLWGVYAMSFCGFVVAASLAAALQSDRHHRWRWILPPAALAVFAMLASRIDFVTPIGKPLSFRLLQINMVQPLKDDPARARSNIDLLINRIAADPADFIVTPETVFPAVFNEMPAEALKRLQRFAQATKSNLLMGATTVSADGSRHNSVIEMPADGGAMQQVDRVYLTALGEYSPPGLAWFARRMNIIVTDLQPGAADQAPLRAGGQRIGALICNEDMTGERARDWLAGAEPATLFINPSNLAWFDGSAASAQRQQLVRMRALEFGRPLLRVANTGVTASIDAHGRVLAQLPAEASGDLRGTVQGMQGLTPYARWGDTPIVLFALCAAAIATTVRMHRPRLPTLPPPGPSRR